MIHAHVSKPKITLFYLNAITPFHTAISYDGIFCNIIKIRICWQKTQGSCDWIFLQCQYSEFSSIWNNVYALTLQSIISIISSVGYFRHHFKDEFLPSPCKEFPHVVSTLPYLRVILVEELTVIEHKYGVCHKLAS